MTGPTKFFGATLDDLPPAAGLPPSVNIDGIRWIKRPSPDEFPLWLFVVDVEEGASLTWGQDHGDEMLYVLRGDLQLDSGARCSAEETLVIESDVPLSARTSSASRFAHFGSWDPTPPPDDPRGAPPPEQHEVRVVPAEGILSSPTDEQPAWRFFADSAFETCRAYFFTVEAPPDYETPQHHHSADQLMYVLSGGLHFGRQRFGPQSCVGIRGEQRYRFHTSEDEGATFLNFRREASWVTVYGPGGEPQPPVSEDMRETTEVSDFVRRP